MRAKGDPRSSHAWRQLSKRVANEEPVCWLQLPGICTQRSTSGDHVIPVKYRPDLALVRSNIHGACGPCNRKRGELTMEQLREIYGGATGFDGAHRMKTYVPQDDSSRALDFFGTALTRDTCRDLAMRTESGDSKESGAQQHSSSETRCSTSEFDTTATDSDAGTLGA